MKMQIIEYSLMLAGTFNIFTSLFIYYRRSGDTLSFSKIVRGQLELNSKEFLINRVGLYVLVMGVVVRYVNQLY